MTIYSAADMGTYEEFLKIFKEGDQNEISPSGRSLLFTALCNTKSKERYRIANFLKKNYQHDSSSPNYLRTLTTLQKAAGTRSALSCSIAGKSKS